MDDNAPCPFLNIVDPADDLLVISHQRTFPIPMRPNGGQRCSNMEACKRCFRHLIMPSSLQLQYPHLTAQIIMCHTKVV
jgi:hypothetical protein